MIKEIHLDSRKLDARFVFRVINLDSRGCRVRELGTVFNAPGKRSYTRQDPSRSDLEQIPDESRTLDDGRFIQGDYVDVAIFLPPK